MLVKVYAKCCKVNQYIQEVDQDDLFNAIQDIYYDAMDRNIINTVVDNQYLTKIQEYFNKNKCISVGDYMIMEVDSLDEITIPNCLGWDTEFIF